MTRWTWIIEAVAITWTALFVGWEMPHFAVLTAGIGLCLLADAVCRAVGGRHHFKITRIDPEGPVKPRRFKP